MSLEIFGSNSKLAQGVSKEKKKVIEIDNDEFDFLPSLLTKSIFDPRILLKPIGDSSVRDSARRMPPQVSTFF